jgi:1-acyl-sn-glycerol-3-phosphate acyltransferase
MDTAAILSVLGWKALTAARPVGAGEYFFRTPGRAWMSRWLLGIIPVLRKQRSSEFVANSQVSELLAPITDALGEGDIVIFFPEGTRGRAGHIGPFKQGIAHLAKQCPGVPIIPLYLAGFSRVFPKGSHLPLPLLCSITVGEAVTGKIDQLADELRERVVALGGEDIASMGVSSAHMVAARRER